MHRAGELGRAAGLGDQRMRRRARGASRRRPGGCAGGSRSRCTSSRWAGRPPPRGRAARPRAPRARVVGRVRAALLVADLGRGDGGAHRRRRAGLGVGVEVDERHRPRRAIDPTCSYPRRGDGFAASPPRDAGPAWPSSARRCPTGPASTCSATRKGKVIYVGKAKSIRSASPATSPTRSPAAPYEMVDAIESVEFVARRLARPRRCWPSRTSSSSTGRASTSACATTSPIRSSRSRWTRSSRASTSRASATAATASTSARTRTPSACAARSTCSARSSCSAPARAPSRAGARGSPCLDYYIKRCGAPCVGYVDAGGVPRVDRRRRRVPLRALPRDRARPRGADERRAGRAQEFEQAALERNRLRAVRSLLERQRVANESVGTLDAVAVAVDGHRRQRAGLPGPRRRALRPPVLLPRERRPSATSARSPRSSCCSTTATQMAIPPQVIVQRGRRATATRWPRRSAQRRGGRGRGARRRARRQAPHPRARRAQRAARARPGEAARPSAAASSASRRSTACRRRSGSTRCRCASSASTSRT